MQPSISNLLPDAIRDVLKVRNLELEKNSYISSHPDEIISDFLEKINEFSEETDVLGSVINLIKKLNLALQNRISELAYENLEKLTAIAIFNAFNNIIEITRNLPPCQIL